MMAIGSSGLYEYEPEFPKNRRPELWFNLFNNMWGTNFPQWIEGDFHYHFTIRSNRPDEKPEFRNPEALRQIEGIPDSLEPVHTMSENGIFYLMLRDRSGVSDSLTISVPGTELWQTDLWHRPLGVRNKDTLKLSVRPYGLHCIAIAKEG